MNSWMIVASAFESAVNYVLLLFAPWLLSMACGVGWLLVCIFRPVGWMPGIRKALAWAILSTTAIVLLATNLVEFNFEVLAVCVFAVVLAYALGPASGNSYHAADSRVQAGGAQNRPSKRTKKTP
jgi:hypothetical protein